MPPWLVDDFLAGTVGHCVFRGYISHLRPEHKGHTVTTGFPAMWQLTFTASESSFSRLKSFCLSQEEIIYQC